MKIIEEIASQTIDAGGDAVEVEYKDGYEEVFPVKGQFGTSIGLRLDSSSKEAASLREQLYEIAKKRRRVTVSGREYELRCRVYDSFGEDAFRLEWKLVKAASTGRGNSRSPRVDTERSQRRSKLKHQVSTGGREAG